MNTRTIHHLRFLTLLLVAAACATRQPATWAPLPDHALRALQAEIDTILEDPAFHNAHWGVMVQSVHSGQILYRKNSRKLFMPASNIKLVTAAVSLARLGADHRFSTRVAACGPIDTLTGTLHGDLVIVGGGDPTFSARFNGEQDPLATFRSWADSLRARGITRIGGDVVGDDDLFDDVHIGPGWAWDYLGAAYAAEIGALLFNEGAVALWFLPGDSVGEPATVSLQPQNSYVSLHGEVGTTDDSTAVSLYASRRPFANDVDIAGAIWVGRDSVTRHVAPHDPTLFFVTVLWETLRSHGIAVSGVPVDRDSGDTECDAVAHLFVHESPSLDQVMHPFLKESQNQIGEMLLRYLGATATDTGSVAAGRRIVGTTLTGWGVPDDSYVYYDGSGLSRYNYLAPEAVVRLLRAMARREDFAAFYDALPVAGVDGTLERRMRGSAAEGNARAKTGFISNARALSGYVTTGDGELLAFSIIANNFDTPVRPVEYVQDLVVERLANFER
ncbi:MAG: D-alanyl-D-alanine carboxypeptidase/D-alanyl-D-alanine-endopeptidase [Gemmatimonadota bacterium]|nr:MAG: D-alanyl-D-alanine carboxypeptidase/D-alanyl-D-alanine-endopeptidase [Gemmatimonadota bacterium]